MAFQSSVLRDGEWVTQTVNFQDALKASSTTPKVASDPSLKAPECGILSRTIIESPVVHWILPVCLRSRSHNDIAFIGVSLMFLPQPSYPNPMCWRHPWLWPFRLRLEMPRAYTFLVYLSINV